MSAGKGKENKRLKRLLKKKMLKIGRARLATGKNFFTVYLSFPGYK